MDQPTLSWVVCGIEYFEPSPLPVDITIFDDQLKSDLTLTNIPESGRRKEWIQSAEKALLEVLGESMDISGEIRLDSKEQASLNLCLLYTSPSPRDRQKSRMPSSA